MTHPLIKVCGITTPDDALMVIDEGATMVGMIFASASPRRITQDSAARMSSAIAGAAQTVGVFDEQDFDEIVRIAEALQLDYVQLSGPATAHMDQLQRRGQKVICAYAVGKAEDMEDVRRSLAEIRLLDSRAGDRIGGTGHPFDWSLAPAQPLARLMLAGGLNAANIREGIRLFRPEYIDLNSGIEDRPGVKSQTKLRLVIDEIRKSH